MFCRYTCKGSRPNWSLSDSGIENTQPASTQPRHRHHVNHNVLHDDPVLSHGDVTLDVTPRSKRRSRRLHADFFSSPVTSTRLASPDASMTSGHGDNDRKSPQPCAPTQLFPAGSGMSCNCPTLTFQNTCRLDERANFIVCQSVIDGLMLLI